MFDLNTWQEIFNTIRNNKLRTFLTGFSIAWGIFMLMILLGSGNGLKNGVTQNFDSETKNVVSIWPGRTSIAMEGFQKGRRIKFDDADLNLIENQMTEIEMVSPTISQYATLSYKTDFVSYSMVGVMPNYQKMQSIEILNHYGRFINDIDNEQQRKVIVLEKTMTETLFKKDENPIGKYINAYNIPFQIVGIYERSNPWNDAEAYIPFSTAKYIFNIPNYQEITFTVNGLATLEANENFDKTLRSRFGRLHTFDPKDYNAIWIWNRMESYIQTLKIFGGITVFIWIIGIGTLIAGIVGVSNIMLITVKERTKEFGIRKAIGATPFSILRLIIMESILITAIFGYVGLVGGVVVTEAVNYYLENKPSDGEFVIFSNPTVDMGIAISATVVLIISGVLAGYFPARKAVKIKPIEALRYE